MLLLLLLLIIIITIMIIILDNYQLQSIVGDGEEAKKAYFDHMLFIYRMKITCSLS